MEISSGFKEILRKFLSIFDPKITDTDIVEWYKICPNITIDSAENKRGTLFRQVLENKSFYLQQQQTSLGLIIKNSPEALRNVSRDILCFGNSNKTNVFDLRNNLIEFIAEHLKINNVMYIDLESSNVKKSDIQEHFYDTGDRILIPYANSSVDVHFLPYYLSTLNQDHLNSLIPELVRTVSQNGYIIIRDDFCDYPNRDDIKFYQEKRSLIEYPHRTKFFIRPKSYILKLLNYANIQLVQIEESKFDGSIDIILTKSS